MKKIFSYSLFEPKTLPKHRFWDNQRLEKQRYWYNIPAIAIINKIVYPEYESVVYISRNIAENPLFEVFNACKNLNYEIIDKEYVLTEPAIWRMIPLWSPGVELCCPRDLDSLTSKEEYNFLCEFIDSDFTVGTIRSHENHHGISCRMLAGLSSFKPNKIGPQIKGLNFEFYYSMKHQNYGSDQDLMIKTFTKNSEFTKKYFLDYKINNQKNVQNFPCNTIEIRDRKIEQRKMEIFYNIQKCTHTTWLGQPCDSRGEILNYLLSYDNEIKNNMLKSSFLKEFYRI